MSLSNSLSSGSAQSVKLLKMNSLPTTDDLRYALSTSKEQRKPVELPFKNAHGNTFTVKVVPPTGQIGPKWSLHRGEGGESAPMWVRESSEVMMIQNKIKIDSLGSAGNEQAENIAAQSQSFSSLRPTITNSGMPAFGGEGLTTPQQGAAFGPPQGAWGPSPIGGPATQSHQQMQSMSQGGWTPGGGGQGAAPAWLPGTGTAPVSAPVPQAPEGYPQPADFANAGGAQPPMQYQQPQPQYQQAPQGQMPAQYQQAPAQQQQAQPQYQQPQPQHQQAQPQYQQAPTPPQMPHSNANSTFSQMQPVQQQGGWMPKTGGGRTMPPPVELDVNIIRDTVDELSDPSHGLTYYRAFTFFLMKEFERHRKFNTKFAFLVFDFCDVANQPIFPTEEESVIIAQVLRSALSPIDDCTRMDSGEFALLICGLGATEALAFSEELWVKIISDPRLARFSQGQQALAIGVSAIPEICADPGMLIATAKEAKDMARKNSNPCSLFSLF